LGVQPSPPMSLRVVPSHTYYVDVVTTSTMYLGATSGALLHTIVGSTVSTWDASGMILGVLVGACYSWSKENYQDDSAGVSTTTNSVGLMVSVVLVVVSEVMLFVSILWSVVLFLVTHTVYSVGGHGWAPAMCPAITTTC